MDMSEHHDQMYAISKKVSYDWKLEKFLDRNGKLESPKFLVSDVHYYIRIHTNGESEEHAGYVSIFLMKESSRTEHRLEVTLGLKRSNGSVLESSHFNHLFLAKSKGLGYTKFIERSKLTQNDVFGPNGTLTVFCEVGDPAVKAETQTSPTYAFETLSEDFEKIYRSRWQTDIVMDVRGERFSTHRLILSSRSSVFRSMFEHDMEEKETGIINITDCDPESFRDFLLFLYSGKLNVVTSDNALGLYKTADKYNVQELKKECSECLARELSIDSVCDVLRLAALYKEMGLLKRAMAYFMKNASKILVTVKWKTFLIEYPTLANELFIGIANKTADS